MTAPEIEDVLALSPLQEGLFALSEMADEFDVYSMQFVVEISGPLHIDRLRRSVDEILARHPNLRVSLWDKGVPKPIQIVPAAVPTPWAECAATAATFDELAADERARRFDLRRGPSLRILLVTLPEQRWRLLVTAHHILMDGWAVALFFRELLAIYSADGASDGLPPVRPYRNYIAWLAEQDHDAAVAVWQGYLDGVEPLMLGTPGIAATAPVRTRHRLPSSPTARLVTWARSTGLTLNTAVAYAWATVLGRLTDRDDVVFGTTISGRPQSLPGADEMIGLFINTVPSRVRLAGAPTVAAACQVLQRESTAMRDAGYLGLSEIQRIAGESSLFDTLFVFENAPIGAATEPVSAADGTRFLPLAMESLAHYPLTVVAYLLDGELIVITEALEGVLGTVVPAEVAERMLHVLDQLPERADDSPDHLDVLLPHERAALCAAASDLSVCPESTYPATVVDAVREQCTRTPDAPALISTSATLTYAELWSAAARLATELSASGVVPEAVVGIALPRSVDTVIAMLATMLAGGAYVPIDVDLPAQRAATIVRQSGAVLVVTDTMHGDLPHAPAARLILDDAETVRRIARRPETGDAPAIGAQSAAYVIFTSGSTGEPKGVIGTHGALVSYCRDHRDHLLAPARARLGRPLRVAHAWTFSFDASWQPLAALLDGHAIHLFDDDDMRDAGRLVRGLADRQIDMIDTTPSMFGQLSAAGLVGKHDGRQEHLTVLALGGEAIGPPLWAQLGALPGTTVYNCYGPTETTVEAVVARVADSAVPTIGTPTDRMRAHVLDSRLRPVPTGVAGELYLSGAQVTRGYVNRAALTATRFVADPRTPGERMYRTGDLVRRNDRGRLLFVGRSDDQVKIRGYRIEVAEIEAALRTLPGVAAAAVVVVERAAGPALVGFAAGVQLDSRTLRTALAEALPVHMIPARIVAVPTLPMNTNGKLDNRVLAESAAAALRIRSGGADGDLTETARAVAAVIGDVLGAVPAADEDFFDLGLDSIVAMAMVNLLREQDFTVTPRMVMSHPTIRDLGEAIDRAGHDGVPARTSGLGPVPAIPIVEWMREFGNDRRFTQTVLFGLPSGLSDDDLVAVLQALIDSHDMLRATRTPHSVVTRAVGVIDAATVLATVDVRDTGTDVTRAARAANDRIDPDDGRMLAATRLRRNDSGDILLLAIHHLAVDAVSWQIIFGDLAAAGACVASGAVPAPIGEHSDYRAWCGYVLSRRDDPDALATRDHWLRELNRPDPALGTRRPDPLHDTWASLRSMVSLTDTDITAEILAGVDRRIGVREFLLAAVTLTIATWRCGRAEDPTDGAVIALEGHGREDVLAGPDLDTTRTLGWFTTVYPVRLGAGSGLDVDAVADDPAAGRGLLAAVADTVAAIPHGGIDFGVLKYLTRVPELLDADEPQVEFNYLGRYDLHTERDVTGSWEPWSPITDLELNDQLPTDPEPELPLRYALDLVAVVRGTPDGPQLVTNWRYSEAVLTADDAAQLAQIWQRAVSVLASANTAQHH